VRSEVNVLLLWSLLACVDPDAPVDPTDTEVREFEVPKGSSAGGLGPKLVEAGLAPSEWQWKLFLRQTDASCLKAGRFNVHGDMSLNELLQTLCGAPLSDDVPFTVLEGWRIRDIDAALVEKGWIAPGDYTKVAGGKLVDAPFTVESSSFEGYLYPETYMVPATGFTPDLLVERQLATFQTRFLDAHADGFGKRSLNEIVAMASMLEREEPKPENRPLVAGILWKRIDAGSPLGVDATSRYTIEQWNDRKAFLKQLRDPDDPYNTRLKAGLPPTAIGNPTVSSLEAAINPVASEFWYYLHDAEQNLHPAKDGAGHEANRKRYNVY
jgi:UPF0755 protein